MKAERWVRVEDSGLSDEENKGNGQGELGSQVDGCRAWEQALKSCAKELYKDCLTRWRACWSMRNEQRPRWCFYWIFRSSPWKRGTSQEHNSVSLHLRDPVLERQRYNNPPHRTQPVVASLFCSRVSRSGECSEHFGRFQEISIKALWDRSYLGAWVGTRVIAMESFSVRTHRAFCNRKHHTV